MADSDKKFDDSDRAFIEAVRQHRIEEKKKVEKYTGILQKDIILLMGEDLTPEDLENNGFITDQNIILLLRERISGRYDEKCRDELSFYTNDILSKMYHNKLLNGGWYPCHGGIQYPVEHSYRLSENGVELLQQYLKDEKHDDALDLLRPF